MRLYQRCNIKKINTSAYMPNCNGRVERQNKTLIDILAKYVNVNKTDWPAYLNTAVAAYMQPLSTRHTISGTVGHTSIQCKSISLLTRWNTYRPKSS
jgi:hypothetical protein